MYICIIVRKLNFNINIHPYKIKQFFNPFKIINKPGSDATIDIYLYDETNSIFKNKVRIMYQRDYAIQQISTFYEPKIKELHDLVNNSVLNINESLFNYSLKKGNKVESGVWRSKITEQAGLSMAGKSWILTTCVYILAFVYFFNLSIKLKCFFENSYSLGVFCPAFTMAKSHPVSYDPGPGVSIYLIYSLPSQDPSFFLRYQILKPSFS